MKNFKIILPAIILLLSISISGNAQIIDLQIPSLNNGNTTLLIQPQQTPINYSITFNANYNGSGGMQPYDIQVCLGVIRDDDNGN